MLGTAGISYCNGYFLKLNCSRVGKICQLSVGTRRFSPFAGKVDDVLPTPQVPCERLACIAYWRPSLPKCRKLMRFVVVSLPEYEFLPVF